MEELILKIWGEIGDMDDVRTDEMVRDLLERDDVSLDYLW